MKKSSYHLSYYLSLLLVLMFVVLPVWFMFMISFKGYAQIFAKGSFWEMPKPISLEAWYDALFTACSGVRCEGLFTSFKASIMITLPSVLVSVTSGLLFGYSLALWNMRINQWVVNILFVALFIPLQVLIYPMVLLTSSIGIFGTLPGLVFVHTAFGLPFITLLFYNYFSTFPKEILRAASMDGAGYFSILWLILLPSSLPVLVISLILQTTGIWNDFILGLIFGLKTLKPVTVAMLNIVDAQRGIIRYNMNMAASLVTASVPLAVYFLSGKWFARTVTGASVKT